MMYGMKKSDEAIVCARQRNGQEGSSPSGPRMRGAVSKGGGNASPAAGGRYGDTYTGTQAKAGHSQGGPGAPTTELRRTGRPSRGGVRRVYGAVCPPRLEVAAGCEPRSGARHRRRHPPIPGRGRTCRTWIGGSSACVAAGRSLPRSAASAHRVAVRWWSCNIGLLLRHQTGVGTPRSLQGRGISAIGRLTGRLIDRWGPLRRAWGFEWTTPALAPAQSLIAKLPEQAGLSRTDFSTGCLPRPFSASWAGRQPGKTFSKSLTSARLRGGSSSLGIDRHT